MVLYRIAKEAYVDDLSGTGARLYGGRWNNKGKAVVYTASSCALAFLEILVHLQPLIIPGSYFSIEIEVPDTSILEIKAKDLPYNWNDILPPLSLKKIGDDFLNKNKYLLLKVPSAIVPMEYNYLLNVQHPDMQKVKIGKKEPFNFDKRLYNN